MILLDDRWKDYERARRRMRWYELLRYIALAFLLVGVGVVLRMIFRK